MGASPTRSEDDLFRHGQKPDARSLAPPVSRFVATTVGGVVATVMAANEKSGGALDAQRFLADRGHGSATTETVLAYVARHDPDHTSHSDAGVAP